MFVIPCTNNITKLRLVKSNAYFYGEFDVLRYTRLCLWCIREFSLYSDSDTTALRKTGWKRLLSTLANRINGKACIQYEYEHTPPCFGKKNPVPRSSMRFGFCAFSKTQNWVQFRVYRPESRWKSPLVVPKSLDPGNAATNSRSRMP